MMFLTRGDLPLEPVWERWFARAEGLLPASALRCGAAQLLRAACTAAQQLRRTWLAARRERCPPPRWVCHARDCNSCSGCDARAWCDQGGRLLLGQLRPPARPLRRRGRPRAQPHPAAAPVQRVHPRRHQRRQLHGCVGPLASAQLWRGCTSKPVSGPSALPKRLEKCCVLVATVRKVIACVVNPGCAPSSVNAP